jgi:hypothetical protein
MTQDREEIRNEEKGLCVGVLGAWSVFADGGLIIYRKPKGVGAKQEVGLTR